MTEVDDIPTPRGQLALRMAATRAHTNAHGDIPAGWLISQMDHAAELTAGREAHGRTATVAVETMDFLCPVRVGSVISIYTEVGDIGHSSIKIDVEVWDDELHKVTEAHFVMVALDDNGRIRAVQA